MKSTEHEERNQKRTECMNDIPCLCIKKINIVNMSVLD